MTQVTDLTPQQLREAADIQEKIAELQARLSQVLGVGGVRGPRKAKRVISAAGIARIRAAQRARWAKIKAQTRG